MAMTKCKECGQQISSKAATCPNCGSPQIKKGGCLVQTVIALVGIGVVLWWLTTGWSQQTDQLLTQAKDKVAADAISQYNIAAKQGDPVQMCAQATMVTAALLQAQDSANYERWKVVEKRDCR